MFENLKTKFVLDQIKNYVEKMFNTQKSRKSVIDVLKTNKVLLITGIALVLYYFTKIKIDNTDDNETIEIKEAL